MFLNILVGVDGSASSRRALDRAIELARTGSAKLTIMTVAPPVGTYVTLAGISPHTMQAELEQWAQNLLKKASAVVPDDVVAHTVQRSGDAGPEIVKELERGGYDLVILGSRGRGRAQEGLLGSVNGYVHFHSRIALLSVPDDGLTAELDDTPG